MDFLLQYVRPGLIILLGVCVVCFVLKWVLLFLHFSALKIISMAKRNMPASREVLDAEVVVIRDKRHIVSLAVAMLVIFACLYGIGWLRRQSF